MEEALLLLKKFDGLEVVYLWELFYQARKLGFSIKLTRRAIAWLFRHDYLEWIEYGKVCRILKHVEISENPQTQNNEISKAIEVDGSLLSFIS